MNFKESSKILNEIKKAKRILVNLHRSPDFDSFGSAIPLYYFLTSLGKDVELILTSTSDISEELSLRPESSFIKFIDYSSFDFKNFDLFISPDSASWGQVSDNVTSKVPEIPIIVIDHHPTNEKFGKINLIEEKAASCSEVIYKLLKDWDFPIEKKIADILLTGIVADTGGFAFSDNSETFRISADLMDLGADKTAIVDKLFRTRKFEVIKYWGEFMSKMEFDRKNKFVWTALPYEIQEKYKISSSTFSTVFGGTIDGSDFGIVMTEDERKSLKISFRSRKGFDVSKLAQMLGGGGHKMAAGAKIEGLSYKDAVKKVLETARKYATKTS